MRLVTTVLVSMVTLSTLYSHGNSQGNLPQMSPFFFMCNYHGNVQELGQGHGEVKLSVSINGNPDKYIPGNFYQVTVSSSLNFDGFFLTGLYTLSSGAMNQMAALGLQAHQPVGQNLMCSIVHSHISQAPVQEFKFMWIAPPPGTGCVSFLASATLQQDLLFKDTTVLQLCEEGAPTLAPLRPALAQLHSDTIIFRDDFDSHDSFSSDYWSSHDGAKVSGSCGTILYGEAAVFCESAGYRQLVTQPLNTTSAAVLQFLIGSGSCGYSDLDENITVSFGLNNCQDWYVLDQFRPPGKTGSVPQLSLIHLPPKARGPGICFAWKQAPTVPKPRLKPTTPGTTSSTHTNPPTYPYGLTADDNNGENGGKHKTTTQSPIETTSDRDPDYTTPDPFDPYYTTPDYGTYNPFDYKIEPAMVNDGAYSYSDYVHEEDPVVSAKLNAAASKTKVKAKKKLVYKVGNKIVSGGEDVGTTPGSEQGDVGQGTYKGCWSLDTVVIVNMAHIPNVLQDSFDPVDPSDWFALPGAHFKDTAAVFDHESKVTGLGSRGLDLSTPDVSADIIMSQQFESKTQPGWTIEGGHVDVTCGIISKSNSIVFDGPGKGRKLCTPYFDTRKAGNVRFHFSLGSGGCHSSGSDKAQVMVYVEDDQDHTLYIIEKLNIKSYKEPRLVSLPLSPTDQHPKARICWLQKYTGGEGHNVWALDNIQVLPGLPDKVTAATDKMAQFSLNLKCGNYPEHNQVDVMFSTNFGDTWYPLHKPCLPGQCDAQHFPVSTVYHGSDYDSWHRVTTPVPYAAMVPNVKFRWSQVTDNKPNWALDNVYIGDCPEGCNGHGTCSTTGCSCDFGHTGPTCGQTVVPNPTMLMENFEGTSLQTSYTVEHVLGASLGYQCDVLSTGKAVVFNSDGHREFVTGELNTTDNMYLQFNIRVGSNSPVSECPPPDETKELVILDYSCNGGITWKLLKTFNIYDYRKPKSDSVTLPESARDIGCKFRWWQPEHSGNGRDVWALDDLSLNDHLFNTLHLHMANMADIGETITVTHGRLSDHYCKKMKSLSFIGEHKEDDVRFLTTESMHVGPGYIMQFDLVMGCGLPYSEAIDNRVYLEYSTDHGIHWNLVIDPCIPPAPCDPVHQGTVYDWTQYREWTRVTVPLPITSQGSSTRFRLRQSEWSDTDTWGVARLYVGQQCPYMCHGHGECSDGICSCDDGYEGDDCHPATHLNDKMQADFGMRYEPDTDFLHIRGGKVVSNNRGCGNIHSDESLYFYDNGIRELITKDMDTRKADYLNFFLRIGGGDRDCNGGEHRGEGIILQYSNDGGTTWTLLDELINMQYASPKLVSSNLPQEAKTPNTRFRWWQPQHSGKGYDQWAIDEIILGHYENLHSLEDDFNDSIEPLDSGVWLTSTGGVIGKYCNSGNPVHILANQDSDKALITKDVKLNVGDVIQFKINVGCSNQFRWDHPVMLQYRPYGSHGFKLVQEACYQEMECDGNHREGSTYYSGPHGHWQLVVIPVTEALAKHRMILRWWQPGGYPYNFALDDVYIGPPCQDNCHRHGTCKQGTCSCDGHFDDPNCQSDDPTPYGMVDRFEQLHRPSDFWKRIVGGHLGLGCGKVDAGNALLFDGEGTREAVTVPLNTTFLRILEFVVKIGSHDSNKRCTQPSSPNEGIVVDYSTDNEITWHLLKLVEPILYNGTTERVVLELPADAKTGKTIFRWWEPLGYGGMDRAEWGLDSVTLGVNDTNLDGFQDDFAGMMPDMFTWYQTQSAVPRITCRSKGNALEFSRNGGKRYAETWDYHVKPSTFLQFDIAMGCDSLYDTLYGVMLEYSTNMGKNWQSVTSECAPPNFECSGYHLKSDYMSDQHRNWTRISVYLPSPAVSGATRFRWKQHSDAPSANVWALDNIYLGDGCPWLCSGHGYCNKGTCECDEGYTGEYCVPSEPLPMMLRDDFNRDKPHNNNWLEVYGGDLTTMCGQLVSGNALTFSHDELRMAVSRDIDTTMLTTIEFYFLYGCMDKKMDWPRKESVLLQYSTNGGITWKLIKELHYRNESGPRFFSLELPQNARHNSTRIRFWQPANGGKMLSTWAVDNLFIGRMAMNPSTMQDEFDGAVQSDSWLFVNDGEVGTYCDRNTRDDTVGAGLSALVFKQGPDTGEHSVITRDLDVGPMSVLQFDINVGCASGATEKYPVHLEYSSDGGKTWSLVAPNCADVSSALCYDSPLHASLYYGGTSKYWRRIVIPLDNLYVCGSLRFRWYQGFIPDDDFGPEWAIDNIYIGMACMQHCLGQGECSSTMMCTCDPGFHGDSCVPSQSYSSYMKEGFPLVGSIEGLPEALPVLDSFVNPERLLDEKKWDTWGGGRVSKACGLLVDGHSLVFQNKGERTLVTRELSLEKATTVQFYLRLGCGKTSPDPATPPVFIQYTTNAGVTWHTIEQFDFNQNSNIPYYVVLNLPDQARSPATQLRWWQPSKDGTFMEDWAVDQIYIGGDYDGVPMMSDAPSGPRDPSWTLTPGALVKKACQSEVRALHLVGKERHRFAVTADVTVQEGTLLQFNLAMGCTHPKYCFSVYLEYSLDKGITWKPVYKSCLPSNVDCNKQYYPDSSFKSDINWGWNRINVPLPYYTKSKATRFRWYQPEGYKVDDDWAVAGLYIGQDCPEACSGHGSCTQDGCICDKWWTGDSCNTSLQQLPQYMYDMYREDHAYYKLAGAKRTAVCKTLASGDALHFTGNCTRVLQTHPLDLSDAVFIQFYFMYGCHSYPGTIDESVIISYSTDSVSWTTISLMHYVNYRHPTFVTVKLPEAARQTGTQIGFQQLSHDGTEQDDWTIDNLRVGGKQVNPEMMVSNFTENVDPGDWSTFDNIHTDEYCGKSHVAIGDAPVDESATLTTQDLLVKSGHMLQFWYNVGCMRPWNATVAPVHLQYSTDYGMTWEYVTPQCLTNNPDCPQGASMASVYYGDPMGRWQRVIIPLKDMQLSKATRFRWQQRSISNDEGITEFGIRDLYIGPACDDLCGGHGNCHPDLYPACHCDNAGYFGHNCYPFKANNPIELKDTFTDESVDKTLWSLVQGGTIQDPCSRLIEGTALVQDGPGIRQLVTVDMDLRDAKFVQYTASIGGTAGEGAGCIKPYRHEQSVMLQYSTDGGIRWHTLHTLDYTSYLAPRRDYLPLPQEARTPSTKVRWWQPLPEQDPDSLQPTWALDNVYIGGKEINPAKFQINFNESLLLNDQPWEFNPYGKIETDICKRDDHVIMWEQGTGNRHFTTKQMIVQPDYILQFKIAVGCSQTFNICITHIPVSLMFNKNPAIESWHEVMPLCLPDINQRMDCRPNMYHTASQFTPDTHPTWTRVTMALPEKTFSSTTRFRWVQDSPDDDAPGWALDDIYVGESCTDMCHGRGDCKGGHCECDTGYTGKSCMPLKPQLPRMFDSFEGGVYTSHWDRVAGGGVGFGCGALLPYAHGKTLYFNGCGLREAKTVEMDLTTASKIMFVLQIGCKAQTAECNVKTSDQSHYRGVLLQYTTNQGSDWVLIARHDPGDHLTPKRLLYDIPPAARGQGVQFRWWQPIHGGEGHDQWAMDHVEIVPGRSMRYNRRRRRYRAHH